MDLNNNVSHIEEKKKEDIDQNDVIAAPQEVASPRKELKVKCTICEKSFFRELMKKHMRVSHPGVKISVENFDCEKLKPTENGSVICLDCNRIFSSIQTAKMHYKHVHDPRWSEIKATENGSAICLRCNKTLSSITAAKVHYKFLHMTNRKVLNYECKKCKTRFAVEEYLNEHIQRMHRSRLNFMCEICSKIFIEKASAKAHYKIQHLIDKNAPNFMCKICQRSFAIEDYMNQHMRRSHGLPYKRVKKGLVEYGPSSFF